MTLIDTGPLVAMIDRTDRYHGWVTQTFKAIEPPLLTCEPVLTEACFLLRRLWGGRDAVLGLLEKGVLRSDFRISSESSAIRRLMSKFADIPMSLADACLVRMTELDPRSAVVTFDRDFQLYRRNQRQVIPTIMPD